MHLISLFELAPELVRRFTSAPPAPLPAKRSLGVLLDFLPLGPEGLALRAAAARAGVDLVEGSRLVPGFPERTDLLDAVARIGPYADLLVLRHPLRGAARAAARQAEAPVLSAGDGTGEDPLFALAEMAALAERLGGLAGKSIALCGDLRHNRTAHALAGGLLAGGARVLLVPAKGAAPDEGFLDGLARRSGSHPVRFEAKTMSSLLDMVDSWLLTPDLDHQLDLFADVVTSSKTERRAVRHQVKEIHALWMAAPRDGRGEPLEGASPPSGVALREPDGRILVSPAGTEESGGAGARIDALAGVLSAARNGEPGAPLLPADSYVAEEGVRCRERDCIACREPARVPPAFSLTRTDPVLLSCVYCLARRRAEFVGSRAKRRYHRLTSGQVRKIKRGNAVFFASEEAARRAGFVPSRI